jgi:uncharacterized protein (DUF885 family)
MPRPSRNLFVPLVVILLASTAPAGTAQVADSAWAGASETDRLYAWFDEVFREELRHSPQTQTALGMMVDPAAYGRWDDPSEAAALAAFQRGQRRVAQMRERFDYDALDDAGRLSYRFAEFQQLMAARQFEVRESGYVFSPIRDVVSRSTSFLINSHRVSEPSHAEAYLSRLARAAPVMDELVAQAEARAAAGVRLPRFAFPRLVAAARAQLEGAPFQPGAEDGALLADFTAKVAALELAPDAKAALRARAEQALVESYGPALERYIAALERMEREADDRAGVWKLPDGEAFYAAQVLLYTTRDDLSPEEIHRIGLAEVHRIQGEMRAIMAQVGFEGSLQEFFEFLRTDGQFYYPDTAEGRQRYIDEATAIIDRLMEAAPRYFGRLPRAGLEVRAVEAFREATATGAFYQRPSLDGSRPGYYYINLSTPSIQATYLMQSLAYHEGAPGHHFQLALAQELEGVPLFQRTAGYSAFSEGWALYAEQLGKDMGFFTDPYMDFGRLTFELFRAVRLVLDTGIHHHRWTREQALEYALANTPMTEAIVEPEVDRYIAWPGQALSYKVGMMTILDLRRRAMERLGDRFDWRGFHDAVLTAGSLPLPLLEQRVEGWIGSRLADTGPDNTQP